MMKKAQLEKLVEMIPYIIVFGLILLALYAIFSYFNLI